MIEIYHFRNLIFSSSGKEPSEPKLSSPDEDKEVDINFGDVLNPSTQMKILHSIQQANNLKNMQLLNQTKKSELEYLQIPKLKSSNQYSAVQSQPNIFFQILENQRIKNSIRHEIPTLNENYIRLLQSSRNPPLAQPNSAYNSSQYPHNNHVNLFGFPPNIIVPKVVSLRNQQQQASPNYGFSVNQNFQRTIHFSKFGEQQK